MQFQAKHSVWTQHCGIVVFNPDLLISDITKSECGRRISIKVTHSTGIFDPVYITVVYAPASRQARFPFLTNLSRLLSSDNASLPNPSRHILLGDLNYTHPSSTSSSFRRNQAPSEWIRFVTNNFKDGVTPDRSSSQPTFCRGVQQSCIDYIFLSNDIAPLRSNGRVTYINPSWTDHFLLTSTVQLMSASSIDTTKSTGKGHWRAHPKLAMDPKFCHKLHAALMVTTSALSPSSSPQERWEEFKATATQVAQAHSRKKAFCLKRAERLLHLRRNKIQKQLLLRPDLITHYQPLQQVVDQQLRSLQEYQVDTLALRAGIRWRDFGELSAGYLKRTVSQRSSKHLIPPLIHRTTREISTTKEDMLDAASSFYQHLYTPEDVDQAAIDSLLTSLPPELEISRIQQETLQSAFTLDDLLLGVSRCPQRSSPGKDGLPYEILRLLLLHPVCQSTAVKVYNDALLSAVFPPSWQDTIVSLLPKTGQLSELSNWRPISLINTDAKVFTRLLNGRVIECAGDLINPFQTGFVRGRFIADNGLLMKLVMDYAQQSRDPTIGLLLDQEKAYDRVHPDYLRQVLLRFKFPPTIVQSICTLFFTTHLRINVNGHLSKPVLQRRGLRQGDPISPVLFNLAFEPLLRRLLQDELFQGITLSVPQVSDQRMGPSTPIKVLAYADDVVCFLKDSSDLLLLHAHLRTYSLASNAKVNFHKTQALSLSTVAQKVVFRAPIVYNLKHIILCFSTYTNLLQNK